MAVDAEVTITNEWGQKVTVYGEAAVVLQDEIDAGRIDPNAEPKHERVITEQELPFLTDNELELAKRNNDLSKDKIEARHGVTIDESLEASAKVAAPKQKTKAPVKKAPNAEDLASK